jgi:hypothetical protein
MTFHSEGVGSVIFGRGGRFATIVEEVVLVFGTGGGK